MAECGLGLRKSGVEEGAALERARGTQCVGSLVNPMRTGHPPPADTANSWGPTTHGEDARVGHRKPPSRPPGTSSLPQARGAPCQGTGLRRRMSVLVRG